MHRRSRLTWVAGIAFLAFLALYTLYAFSGYIRGPIIDISFPYQGFSTSSAAISVRGRAKDVSFLTLDDRPIYIDGAGNWQELLLLPPGLSIIKVYGKDRFNREVTMYLSVQRTSPYAAPAETLPATTTKQ